jgi:Ca-activated chloride channel family protein
VKLQIAFNPNTVEAYRLVGYDSRLLRDEDFENDAIDAGEMGAGHVVTAFYELVPAANYNKKANILTVNLRYKQPDGNVSKLLASNVSGEVTPDASADFRFAAAVAMFSQLLRSSEFSGDASFDGVISLAGEALAYDPNGYRHEFLRLVETAKGMANEKK